MLRRFLAVAMLATLLVPVPSLARRATPPPAAAQAGPLAEFAAEAPAQAHCAQDEVVWLNTRTHVFHEKGIRWYGHTRQGAYVCRREALAAGMRDTRNGQ